jgi:putative FmdB family regulatory protein
MTYTYGCDSCGEFEHDQPMTSDALAACPKCTGTDIQRLITGGQGFQLKGGGWFSDGYSDNGAGSDRASFDKETSK